MRSGRGRGERGFTLAEMAVAMGVAVVLLATALTAAEVALPLARVLDGTHRLQSLLRTARLAAVTRGQEMVVAFEFEDGRFALAPPPELPPGSLPAGGPLPAPPPRALELPAGVRFVQPDGLLTPPVSPTSAPDQAVLFDARGRLVSAASPVYIYLGHPRPGVYRRVRLSRLGEPAVERWDGSAWR